MRILFIDPYLGGSHALFPTLLSPHMQSDWHVLGLPPRHWKWRMRGSAPYLALAHTAALREPHDLLLASSYLPLAELLGLVPELQSLPRVLYFHENQFAYTANPAAPGPPDFHPAMTQMVSALAADRCLFNSQFNRDSFLEGARSLLHRLPDPIPDGWVEKIESKSQVVHFPLEVSQLRAEDLQDDPNPANRKLGPILLWNHRWEHDKGPDLLFEALRELLLRDVPFRLAVCGQRFRSEPAIFEQARASLAERCIQWGELTERSDYRQLLTRTHVVLSTALQEFFGVSVLEATQAGAYPLVPDRLVYPELYPQEHRYGSRTELIERLEFLCRGWARGELDLRADRRALVAPFFAPKIAARLTRIFDDLVRESKDALTPRVRDASRHASEDAGPEDE